ncbi:MAG: hypothetical protein JW882_03010 [Deltaproteobacteria bacterium]|nr:hypothetical protein [Deltaproteobacteria bacterium]
MTISSMGHLSGELPVSWVFKGLDTSGVIAAGHVNRQGSLARRMSFQFIYWLDFSFFKIEIAIGIEIDFLKSIDCGDFLHTMAD